MNSPNRATIAFGTVRHRRLRPRLHAFAYRAFFLRLPLRTMAGKPYRSGLFSYGRRNLFSFLERDHGPRDGSSLVSWIDTMLAAHGIKDADGEIWLQAFPRVFNYVFNPISMWFCERQDGSLRAVCCEVNNTFGETHCYLLYHDDGTPLLQGETLRAPKMFHVSPFCEVEGEYLFRFITHEARAVARIDYDDKDGPLINTSISGTMVPMSNRTLLHALISYPVFTFGVVARIHWQAVRLALKRVPFFSKPAPPALEVSR
jgi:uncharacterized protein